MSRINFACAGCIRNFLQQPALNPSAEYNPITIQPANIRRLFSVLPRIWRRLLIVPPVGPPREQLERETESLRTYGDKRRFRLFDPTHNRVRHISAHDVYRRATAEAHRSVANLKTQSSAASAPTDKQIDAALTEL